MLGDSVNLFSQVDLNRFYLSSMAGYYPLEQNAFDTTRKRCQKRSLRRVTAANTILIVCVAEYDPYESNVVDIFSRKNIADANKPIEFSAHRRNLEWKVLYLREAESA